MSSKTQIFINKIYPHAVEDMKQSKILASLTIAQAILESGWGESKLAKEYNNLFGIKKGDGWNGETISSNGSEWRVYDSWLGSIKDHSELLKKPRYVKVIQAKDYKTACEEVRLAGYCTESDYSQKLIRLIEQYDLAKYDTVEDTEQEVIDLELYRVRKTWEDAKSQIGAYRVLDYAKVKANEVEGYSVFDSKGEVVYTPFKPYLIKMLDNDLPIYQGESIDTPIIGYVSRGEVFTIVEEQHDFLKLKSGKGWLLLNSDNMVKLDK